MSQITTSGLKKVVDIRDKGYNHAKIFGAPALPELPKNGLGRKPGFIYDQGNTQYCTAYATAGASSFQEGVTLSPEWQAAKTGQVAGAPIFRGADLRDGLKSAILFGSIEQKDCPYTLKADGEDKVGRWQNYPGELTKKGLQHVKEGFYDVKNGPYDTFDNIRSALFSAKDKNGVAIVGTPWYDSWNIEESKKNVVPTPAFGEKTYLAHAWVIYDFDDTYLYAQLSSGLDMGDKGVLRFTRETVNLAFKEPWTCAFILRDKEGDSSWLIAALRIMYQMVYVIQTKLTLVK